MSALRLVEQEFDVTFKVHPNGRASGYLNRLQIGDSIQSFGMAKNKCRNPGGKWIGIVAYGVGITEALPMARAELERPGPGPLTTVTSVWASRTLHDTFSHDQIQALQQTYSETNKNENDTTNRFEMAFLFSRESNEFFQALSSAAAAASNATTTTSQVHIPVSIRQARHVLSGRVTASVLSTVFDQACHEKEHARFLSVGTKDCSPMNWALAFPKTNCFPNKPMTRMERTTMTKRRRRNKRRTPNVKKPRNPSGPFCVVCHNKHGTSIVRKCKTTAKTLERNRAEGCSQSDADVPTEDCVMEFNSDTPHFFHNLIWCNGLSNPMVLGAERVHGELEKIHKTTPKIERFSSQLQLQYVVICQSRDTNPATRASRTKRCFRSNTVVLP